MKAVQARHYHRGRTASVRVVVVHDMEWAETATTAEDCARMFATMDREASAHVCVDSDSAVRCVADSDTAWAAPGCNHDGLQLEMAGFARQTKAQWLDTYSLAALGQGARVVADWCNKYGIPIKHLTVAELKAGKKGIVGHVDVSRAYGLTSHTDPGTGFPWDHFLDLVRLYAKGETPTPALNWTEILMDTLPLLRMGCEKDPKLKRHIKSAFKLLDARGWPLPDGVDDQTFGTPMDKRVREFQKDEGLDVDGLIGRDTWIALH